jgi:hypothetical protein
MQLNQTNIERPSDFTLVKVNHLDNNHLVEYFAILQPHASTLLHKANLNGKSVADRILQIERNNLNGLTLKEYQTKYNINNSNRFNMLHGSKFEKLDNAKKAFYLKNLEMPVALVGSGEQNTLQGLIQNALQGNLQQEHIGMFFVKDNNNQKIAGIFGMVVQGVDATGKINKVELVNHLKEEYTGIGLAKDLIMQIAREQLIPAIDNREFSTDARYVIETKIDNDASLRAQRHNVSLNWFDKITGATLTEEQIPGSRIIRQEDSIAKLGLKAKVKTKLDDLTSFASCQSR